MEILLCQQPSTLIRDVANMVFNDFLLIYNFASRYVKETISKGE